MLDPKILLLIDQAATNEDSLRPLLNPVSVADVFTSPSAPPQFIWDGYLPRGVVSLFAAHGGTGKSTLALMLGICVTAGRPLFGVDTVQCKTLFVSLEDSAHIVRHRIAFICRTWGINPSELEGNLLVVDGTENPELFSANSRNDGSTTPTYEALKTIIRATDVGLLIIDNASDAYGGDEIQRRQVRAFIRSLVEVARLTDCAVMLLAHVDKSTSRGRKAEGGESYSGSTAWHNSARSRLFMTRGEDGSLTLEHQKSNLGKCNEPIKLVWLEGGLPKLQESGSNWDELKLLQQEKSDDEKATALLKLILEYEGRMQYASPAPTARTNVHALMQSDPLFQKLKLKANDTKRIVTQCNRANWLAILDYRSHDRKPRQRWSVTTEGRLFAGLAAPTAPSAPTSINKELSAEGTKGAPTAPTCAGGMGDGERAQDVD